MKAHTFKSRMEGSKVRKLQVALGLVLLLALVGRANAQNIETDTVYDHQVDFAQFNSFKWIRPPRLADPLTDSRVRIAVDGALTAKGWQVIGNGNAAVGVLANGAIDQRRSLQSFYGGFGGWRWWGWGPDMLPKTSTQTYDAGTLLIDLFEIHNKQLIWRSMATKALSHNSQKDTQSIRDAIQQMFANFPPGS